MRVWRYRHWPRKPAAVLEEGDTRFGIGVDYGGECARTGGDTMDDGLVVSFGDGQGKVSHAECGNSGSNRS